jgi:hypothetical protein
MIPEKMFDNMDELIALHMKMSDTMRELKKGLRLAQLLNVTPKDMGRVKTRVEGDKWRHATLHVQREGREEQVFKLADIHIDLWPADMAAGYKREKYGKQ